MSSLELFTRSNLQLRYDFDFTKIHATSSAQSKSIFTNVNDSKANPLPKVTLQSWAEKKKLTVESNPWDKVLVGSGQKAIDRYTGLGTEQRLEFIKNSDNELASLFTIGDTRVADNVDPDGTAKNLSDTYFYFIDNPYLNSDLDLSTLAILIIRS